MDREQGWQPLARPDKLNCSADLLANAFRNAIAEAVEVGVQPLREDIAGIKQDIDERFKRLETDMENGFAELRPPK